MANDVTDAVNVLRAVSGMGRFVEGETYQLYNVHTLDSRAFGKWLKTLDKADGHVVIDLSNFVDKGQAQAQLYAKIDQYDAWDNVTLVGVQWDLVDPANYMS